MRPSLEFRAQEERLFDLENLREFENKDNEFFEGTLLENIDPMGLCKKEKILEMIRKLDLFEKRSLSKMEIENSN